MDNLPAPEEGGIPPVEKEEEVPQSQVPTGEKGASTPQPEHREQRSTKEAAQEKTHDLAREAATEGEKLAGQLGNSAEVEEVNRPQAPAEKPKPEERPAVSQFTYTAIQEGLARQVARSRLRQASAQGKG